MSLHNLWGLLLSNNHQYISLEEAQKTEGVADIVYQKIISISGDMELGSIPLVCAIYSAAPAIFYLGMYGLSVPSWFLGLEIGLLVFSAITGVVAASIFLKAAKDQVALNRGISQKDVAESIYELRKAHASVEEAITRQTRQRKYLNRQISVLEQAQSSAFPEPQVSVTTFNGVAAKI